MLALGRLDSIANLVSDPKLIQYHYVRKEAVLSSEIEGTESSLSDLLRYENEQSYGVPEFDVEEVSNYVAAMEMGLREIKAGSKVTLELIARIHARLMKGVRGKDKSPGEFRVLQNWVGGTSPDRAKYVPPPPDRLQECLQSFEQFIAPENRGFNPVVKAGLAHAQFETIHPFLDGNGRLGRLLITFLLCADSVMQAPLLYLSLFLKTHQSEYYERLQRIRTHGEWEEWLRFYYRGVEQVSTEAYRKCVLMIERVKLDRQNLQKLSSSTVYVRLHELLAQRIFVEPRQAQRQLNTNYATVNNALKQMEKIGIVNEVTGQGRNRIFCYQPYLDIINE